MWHLNFLYKWSDKHCLTLISCDWIPFSAIEDKIDRTGKKAAMTDRNFCDSFDIFQGT